MKRKSKSSLKRAIAFVSALVIVATTTIIIGADANKGEVKKYADDYTSLFPGLTDTKLKLSDPVFTEKDWYEYVEYIFYTDVQDGDMIYRIYQPDDYAMASIMAIGDYNPNDITGNQTNLSMNLGELQGIFDIAAQGSSISKDFAGLNVVSGIAENMNNIGEVMDNSKYYSSSSFLGIPDDAKYSGVSNDGFFNADSLEITIEESVTVSACKTIAMDSGYSIAESYASTKDFSTYKEYGEAKNTTHEESKFDEKTDTAGKAITKGESETHEKNRLTATAIIGEVSDTLTTSVEIGVGTEIGPDISKATLDVTTGISNAFTISASTEKAEEIGESSATTEEKSITRNTEQSKSSGNSTTDSTSIENSLTNGTNSTSGQEHAKDVAVDIGYGVDYQYGNDYGKSIAVTRVFNAREDEEVKNVGWKLCEYVVKVPYYIEAIKTDSSGNETILYGQYVNYNLLNGVSRVFANGYIEHWYNGELVTYADFFEGFITANELVDMAKEQASSNIEMGGE